MIILMVLTCLLTMCLKFFVKFKNNLKTICKDRIRCFFNEFKFIGVVYTSHLAKLLFFTQGGII